MRRLCGIAFADPAVRRLEIHHDRANEASGRVAAAAGFTHLLDRRDTPGAPGEEGVERVWGVERRAG